MHINNIIYSLYYAYLKLINFFDMLNLDFDLHIKLRVIFCIVYHYFNKDGDDILLQSLYWRFISNKSASGGEFEN